MITNDKDINEYKNFNKLYIPENYNNSNWSYRFNGDYIYIITNQGCYTQYSSTYCNCYMYNYKNNVMSETYTCNTNNSNPIIAYSNITSDINYSTYIKDNFIQDKSLILGMFILGIIFAILFLGGRRK